METKKFYFAVVKHAEGQEENFTVVEENLSKQYCEKYLRELKKKITKEDKDAEIEYKSKIYLKYNGEVYKVRPMIF